MHSSILVLSRLPCWNDENKSPDLEKTRNAKKKLCMALLGFRMGFFFAIALNFGCCLLIHTLSFSQTNQCCVFLHCFSQLHIENQWTAWSEHWLRLKRNYRSRSLCFKRNMGVFNGFPVSNYKNWGRKNTQPLNNVQGKEKHETSPWERGLRRVNILFPQTARCQSAINEV